MRQQQEQSKQAEQSGRGKGQTLLPYEEEPLAIVVAAARPLCEQTKPKYVSSFSSPGSCTTSSSCSSPVFAMSNQLAAGIMPHSNLCRSWIICSTRSFRVLHAGVDTQQQPKPAPPPATLSNHRALRFPFRLFPPPLVCSCALVLLSSCKLV